MATRLKTVADLCGTRLTSLHDAFDYNSMSPAGGPIQSFSDESVLSGARPGGTQVVGTQNTANLRPTYSGTGLNGQPCFSGDGTQFMELSPPSGLPIGQSDVTIFALLQGLSGYKSNSVVMAWGTQANGVEHLFGFGNGNPYWWYTDRGGGSGDFHGTSDVTAGPTLCILSLDATGSDLRVRMRVNGVVEATGTGKVANFGADGARLLYTIGDYCNPAKCNAAVVGTLSGILSADEEQQLESILLFRQKVQTSTGGPLNSNNNAYYAAAPTVNVPSPFKRRGLVIPS